MKNQSKDFRYNQIKYLQQFNNKLQKVILYLSKNQKDLVDPLLVRAYRYVQKIIPHYIATNLIVFYHCGYVFHRRFSLDDPNLFKHLSINDFGWKAKPWKLLTIGFAHGSLNDSSNIGIQYKSWKNPNSIAFNNFDNKWIYIKCYRHNRGDGTVSMRSLNVSYYFLLYVKVIEYTVKLYIQYDKKKIHERQTSCENIKRHKENIQNGQYSWDKIFHNN